MALLRRLDRSRYILDFAVREAEAGFHKDEIERLGSRVFRCPGHPNPWRFARGFRDVLDRHGPYDIVHAHLEHFSGIVVRSATLAGVRARIVHAHTAGTTQLPTGTPPGRLVRRVYRKLMERWINRDASLKLAASRAAASHLFGRAWSDDPLARVVHCGIDLRPFGGVTNPWDSGQRPRDAARPDITIGHVGRFVAPKNHEFLLQVAALAMDCDQRFRLLLVGNGPLHAQMDRRAEVLGIADRVTFAGERNDVAALMKTMDLFLFPSTYEGLGLALVEAQAAGLPCVISDRVPEEADVVAPLVRRLPLEAPTTKWVETILQATTSRPVSRAKALEQVASSDFNIEASSRAIERLYDRWTLHALQ